MIKTSEVKWIKITTDMFDNRKIRHLRKFPDGNNIVLIWVMLLTMAGRCNAGGLIFLTESIPYTPKMLADELDFEENTVRLALEALERLGMVVRQEGYISVPGWEEHQNVDGLERIREQNRVRKKRQRENEKQQIEMRDCHVTGHGDVTQCHATDIDKELERESESEREEEGEVRVEDLQPLTASVKTVCRSDMQKAVDAWNALGSCGIKQVSRLNIGTKRYVGLIARIKEYGIDEVLNAIERIRQSDFLQGKNKQGWTITFDWFVLPNNFPKVHDGNYDNSRPNINTDLGAYADALGRWAEDE